MALLQIDFRSQAVGVNLPLNIIIPDDCSTGGAPMESRKLLYLLHGLSEDASAWQRYTNIEMLAREHGLVVIMPSGGRSFYTDMDNGQAYFSYLTEELPAFLKASFRFSDKREQNFIAGLSMGGYGCFKAAFLRPDLYAAACSLSGVLAVNALLAPSSKIEDQKFFLELELIFGGMDKIPGSIHDPERWLRMTVEQSLDLPRLYAYCGTEDDLLPMSHWFAHAAGQAGIPLVYEEGPGAHTWHFWQHWIEKFIEEIVKF
jgi:S-formylglutathione hydrolase FrmB